MPVQRLTVFQRRTPTSKAALGTFTGAAAAVGPMRDVRGETVDTTTVRLSDQLPAGYAAGDLRGIRRTRDDPTGTLGGAYAVEDLPAAPLDSAVSADGRAREFRGLVPDTLYTLTTAAVLPGGTVGPVTAVTARTASTSTVGGALPDSLPWDGRTRPGVGTGDLVEKAYTKVVSIAGAGMVEGTGGDPVANGDKFRAFLTSVMSGTTGQVCVEIPATVPQRFRIAGNVNMPARLTLKGLGVTNGRPDPSKVTFEHTTDLFALFMVNGQNDVELFNFTHYVAGYTNIIAGTTSARSSQGQRGEGNTWVQGGAQRFRAQDYIAHGSHDAAIFFYGAHNFTLNRVESRDSQSDAFHVSNGSSYGTWYDCKSVSSGDDGIGFVGYGGEGPGTPHHHTVVRHQVLEQSPNGRGFGNIHVHSIRYFGPTLVEDSWAAAFICAREPQYGSGQVRDIKVYGEFRTRRANKSPTIEHGAILLANDGTDGITIEDIYFEGPLILVGTGELRTGNPPQVGIRGGGPVTNVYFGLARFFNPRNDPDVNQTKFRADGTNKTAITLSGWNATTPTEAGAEPAFPLPTSAVVVRQATMEDGSLTGTNGFSSTNQTNGTFTVSTTHAYRGTRSARAVFSGGPSNGFARGLQHVAPLNLTEGSQIGAGAAFRFDVGFKAANKYVDLLRLDNFDVRGAAGTSSSNTDHLGICLDGRQYDAGQGIGGMRLLRTQVGRSVDTTLGYVRTDAQIPEDQWVYLEMYFTLSKTAGQARNRVWVNGELVLDNTSANLFSDFVAPWSYCRSGIVAVNPAIQTASLGLYLDNSYISTGDHLGVPA